MKIYKVQDDYRGKTKWCHTKRKAKRCAAIFASDLELTECCVNDGADWITVDEITNKSDLVDILNQRV